MFLLALVTLVLAHCTLQTAAPDTVLNCCEGDVLVLLDSSGSVSSYEFKRLLDFLAGLLRPFSLGRGQVGVGLLQVGTRPRLEFGLRAHSSQAALQAALLGTRQLQGDTNTQAALRLARRLLPPGGASGDGTPLPQVLLWLTDGVQPGDVEQLMSDLKDSGVAVLAVSTGHGNYQLLHRAVTPPIESHLYFVDIDDINIITGDLREAIIEIIRAERLRVAHLTWHSAVLQWRPVLSAQSGSYRLRYHCVREGAGAPRDGAGGGCVSGRQHSRTLSGGSTWEELTDLRPDTTYTASLTPESNQTPLKTLSVTFTTLPEVLSPAVVSVSDSGPRQIRVGWAPLQPARVQRYEVEYGAIPRGPVHVVTVNGYENSTLLTDLEPDTQYLVTVSAVYATGQGRALSVRACTQPALPTLVDLDLTPVGREAVRVRWRGGEAGLRGYWLRWEGGDTGGSLRASSRAMRLPPGSLSVQLTHVAPSSRICVAPIYGTGRGDGLCCTTAEQADL